MRREEHMKRQNVDVPIAVVSRDSGQDSGYVVNPFMRVTKYMTRHLATLRESQLLPPFTGACLFFINLTFGALGRNQCQYHLRPSQCCVFQRTVGLHLSREASKNIPANQMSANVNTFVAAQISRQGRLNPILRANLVPKVTCVRVFWTLPFGMSFLFVFVTGLRSGQKDDEEVFSETCENSSVSQESGNSSCHKVRSSRHSVDKFPLGLDDLTLWHDELPNFLETLLFSRVSLNRSWRDGQE